MVQIVEGGHDAFEQWRTKLLHKNSLTPPAVWSTF